MTSLQLACNIEAVRLGELMFIYKDSYGVPEGTLKDCVEKVVRSEDYQERFRELISCIESNYSQIVSWKKL